MYLYGLDLSLSNTGISIVDLNTYNPILVDSVKTNAKLDHKDRLKQITDKFDELIHNYPPSLVVIEEAFTRFNKATQALYKVRGVSERWFHDLEIVTYRPNEIKATIYHGQGSKEMVRKQLELRYPHIEFKNEDESDALAIAVTYLVKRKLIEWERGVKDKS